MATKSRCRCPHCHKSLEKDTITLTEKGETAKVLQRLTNKGQCLHSDIYTNRNVSMSTSHAMEALLKRKMISRKKQWVYTINKSGAEALNNLLNRINLKLNGFKP